MSEAQRKAWARIEAHLVEAGEPSEELKQKVAGYVAAGAVQRSRKYRSIVIPPETNGRTYLELLEEAAPEKAASIRKQMEAKAKETYLYEHVEHTTLDYPEFYEYLRQTGRSVPLAIKQAESSTVSLLCK